MRTTEPVATRLADYQPFAYDITRVVLVFDLHPTRTVVKTKMFVWRKEGTAPGEPLRLDGEDLELLDVRIDGAPPVRGQVEEVPGGLVIGGLPDRCVIETTVAINPEANTRLSGLYMSGGRFCTQCEAEGFRRITYWPDRPDVMSVYFVRLEADEAAFPTLLANGNPTAAGSLPNGRHFAEWDDPWRKPSYLFALVAGRLDVISDTFTRADGRPVDLNIYVDPGNGSRATYAMDALKRSMAWDESAFGRLYDLDVFNIVAVQDFNFGAMENKGLNIFNSALLLADADTATDLDFELIEAVVAHEYFHNWSGNRVTCRDWFQLSLKEGFTVYRDQEFSADMRSRAVKRIKDVKMLRGRQFPEDAGPLAHPVRPASYVKIDNFYTATIYEKGAEIIRVLAQLVGPEAFRAGCDRYFAANDGRAATIEDWLAAHRDGTGQFLDGMERWYAQAGTPVLRISALHDPQAQTLSVSLAQHTPDTPGQTGKSWVPIPVSMAFFAPDGRQMTVGLPGRADQLDQVKINLSGPGATVTFTGMDEKPVISALRGFSAPVKLQAGLSEADFALLAAHDTDPFNRWEALQTLARSALVTAGRAVRGGAAPVYPAALIRALGAALDRAWDDPAYTALLIRMPEVADLMQIESDADPTALLAGRRLVRGAVFDALGTRAEAVLAAYDPETPFRPDAASAGVRALAAACLDLIAAGGTAAQASLALSRFHAATNMTDTMAALDALGQIGGPAWDEALGQFRQRWNGETLVMDKWFGVQAASTCADPVATFHRLRDDSAFTLATPNRVRALAAPFAVRNPAAFHRADGAGYQALAQLIGDADARNPALAARLSTFFEATARVDRPRRERASAVIGQLLERKGLSANTGEILGKIAASLGS
jgi:aminopeptidase N